MGGLPPCGEACDVFALVQNVRITPYTNELRVTDAARTYRPLRANPALASTACSPV